ncbi:MAG: MFS transporter [Rhodospirillales bacterium]
MLAATLAPWFGRRGIHYGWVMVALTFLTVVCTSAATSLPGVLLLPLTKEFGWSRGDVSGATAVMFVLVGGLAPFAGALMLRYGVTRIVSIAAVLVAVALTGTTQVEAKWQLWVCLGLFLGMAGGLTAMALAATIANRWFVARRGLAMGCLAAAFAAGQLSFIPAAAWLASTYGWRMAVFPAIVGAGICAVLYILLARDWPADIGMAPYGETAIQPKPAASAQNAAMLCLTVLREAIPHRTFWVLAGTFFICGLSTAGIVGQHFIPFCADNGVGPVQAASFLAMMGIFNFIGTICSGWLSDRFDNRVLLGWYYGLRGLSLIWLPFSSFDVVSLSLFAMFFGLDFIATVPPTVRLAAQHFGAAKAPIVFGWAFAAHQLGNAVSALGAALSRDAWASYLPAYFVVGLICLLATMAVFTVPKVRPATVAA